MKNSRPQTLEEMEDKWRLDEFGVCVKCKTRLVYNDDFVDVARGSCGSSQGHPYAYVKSPERYHIKCYGG